MTEPVWLNEDPAKPGLHVYTTTSDLEYVTGCARGNAVYDAHLDAIFVDENILRPVDRLYWTDPAWISIYQRFILLHELGHRQLHRKTGGLFDTTVSTDPAGRRREAEADAFALARLGRYSKLEQSSAGGGSSELSPWDGLEMASLDGPVRAAQDCTMAFLELAAASFRSPSPFSAFYEDRDHPTFLDRGQSLVDTALDLEGLEQSTRAYLSAAKTILARTKTFRDGLAVEVSFPEPIDYLGLDERGLRVVSRGRSLYSVNFEQIRACWRNGERTLAVADRASAMESAHETIGTAATWLMDSRATGIRTSETFMRRDNPLYRAMSEHHVTNVMPAPQPGAMALVLSERDDMDQLSLTRGGQVLATRDLEEIKREVGAQGFPDHVEVQLAAVTPHWAYVAVVSRRGDEDAQGDGRCRPLSVVTLDASDLRVLGTHLIGEPPVGVVPRAVGVMPANGARPDVLVLAYRADPTAAWVVYKITPMGRYSATAEHPVVNSSMVWLRYGGEPDHGTPVLTWVPPASLVIDMGVPDAAYLYDATAVDLRPVFWGGLRTFAGADGAIVLTQEHAYKCLVIPPPVNLR